MEADPNGLAQHAPGAKLDKGKIKMHLLQQFSLALTEVAKVATYGCNKYSEGGWQEVEDGFKRYSNAMLRHYFKESSEMFDIDSNLCHEAHLAWNALARLELKLKAKGSS